MSQRNNLVVDAKQQNDTSLVLYEDRCQTVAKATEFLNSGFQPQELTTQKYENNRDHAVTVHVNVCSNCFVKLLSKEYVLIFDFTGE